MRSQSSRQRRQSGFTLVEMLVTAISLVIILTISGQLMFSMRRGIVRQQLQVEARQNARAALDYTTMLLRGATDFNAAGANAGSILSWLWTRCAGCPAPVFPVVCPGFQGCYQVSYNNVTNASFADLGTDVITFSRPTGTTTIGPLRWPGWLAAGTVRWQAEPFCQAQGGDSAKALQAFKDATGGHSEGTAFKSVPMVLADDTGAFVLYQITDYQDSSNTGCCSDRALCREVSDNPPVPSGQAICFKVQSTSGLTSTINAPGAQETLTNPRLMAGAHYVSLRVRNGWLEQKEGAFDPNADNPGNNFVPILPNIEDLQIAWVFADGSVRNTSTANRIASFGAVPQMGANPIPANDVRNVMGLRISVTARSAQGMPIENNRLFRPASEDHDAGTQRDTVYRFLATANAMVRNRLMGV